MSNIRVFVQWSEASVFAGEDIECQITFRNIAAPAVPRTALQPNAANGVQERLRKTTGGKGSTGHRAQQTPRNKSHRTTLSLNVPVGSSHQNPRISPKDGPPISSGSMGPHQRSVSIISITTSETGGDGKPSSGALGEWSRRVSKGHGRSASLQIAPRHGNNGTTTPAPIYHRSPTQSDLIPSSPNATESRSPPGPHTVTAAIPSNATGTFAKSKSPTPFPHNFKFPAAPSTLSVKPPAEPGVDSGVLLSPRIRENIPDQIIPTARILSPASIAGTPRSSGEFYSLSNNSTETLASEYQPQQSFRGPKFNGHVRRTSNLAHTSYLKPPESLMMGYAQIHGSFTLDSSLINQSSFEEVKRKGAIGGQGGGVIGVETKKRDSGLLRGFGWSNLGESFGGLLSSGELSSMKDMRDIASSRSVPLLSTPQSILFVDLRLAPGESKSYNYTFKLPRGLPPSHRGKAIKISYKLIVGTQRPGGAKEQQVKSVEIPFRVFGGVNSHGELLGHDLMSPYIILRDQAQVRILPDSNAESIVKSEQNTWNDSTLDHFLAYTEDLLTKPRQNSSLGLLSPLESAPSRRQSHVEEPITAREAIDMAILRSNTATDSQQSANRFEIARSGKRVAVIMLARPSYRLGETVTAIIDFTDVNIPSYAVHASLESSETIQASISLRSEASVLRVTRKTYVSHSESTLFSRRVVFSPTIPTSATPAFFTSGVNLEWRVRVEFVTPQLEGREEGKRTYPDRLEAVVRDDRGVILAAAESIDCESFEVSVPLRVYGALGGSTDQMDASTEGMVV